MSYDLQTNFVIKHIKLKGHQIIGELRLDKLFQTILPCHWKVTRSLVSYDLSTALSSTLPLRLKGHQIIGELRPLRDSHTTFPKDWKVTRSLVSYDIAYLSLYLRHCIERSPDHWWVTTLFKIKKHVINIIERSPDHWWVTTNFSLVFFKVADIERSPDHWWVTTYLTNHFHQFVIERSPDHWWVTTSVMMQSSIKNILKGHQIIGELRR